MKDRIVKMNTDEIWRRIENITGIIVTGACFMFLLSTLRACHLDKNRHDLEKAKIEKSISENKETKVAEDGPQ
jgi:hypothetical protein